MCPVRGRSSETVNAVWPTRCVQCSSVKHRYGNRLRLFIVTSAQITSRKPAFAGCHWPAIDPDDARPYGLTESSIPRFLCYRSALRCFTGATQPSSHTLPVISLLVSRNRNAAISRHSADGLVTSRIVKCHLVAFMTGLIINVPTGGGNFHMMWPRVLRKSYVEGRWRYVLSLITTRREIAWE